MNREIVGAILPDTEAENALLMIRSEKDQLLCVIFSKQQALDLLSDYGNWSDRNGQDNYLRLVGGCGLPVNARTEPILIGGKPVAHLDKRSIHYLGDHLEDSAGLRPQKSLRVLNFEILGTEDETHEGVYSFLSDGKHFLYLFYSLEQGRSVLNPHRARLNEADYQYYRGKLENSNMAKAKTRQIVKINGFVAEKIGMGFQRRLLTFLSRHCLRTPC